MKTRVLFTSDLHIGHENILKFEPISRPFQTIEEHDKYIIGKWNHYVQERDVVYLLGDIGMKVNKQYMKDVYAKLSGTKILVRGNHDKYTNNSLFELGFSAILEEAKLLLSKHVTVKLSHYPYWDKDHVFESRFKDKRPVREDFWLLHGHTHSNGPKIDPNDKSINIGWDHWKRPVRRDEILDIIRKEELNG